MSNLYSLFHSHASDAGCTYGLARPYQASTMFQAILIFYLSQLKYARLFF